jgi:predicted lipid-binding transport protein (Tim44 family)
MGAFDGVMGGLMGSSGVGGATSSSGGGWMGISNSDWLGAGMTMLGGFLNDRGSSRNSRAQQQMNAAQIQAQRDMSAQNIRGQMQQDQDNYARTIMRNRGAIAPWREMYSGPNFQSANPNAPIYNPLMESGHLFQELAPKPAEVKPAPVRRRKK